MSVLLVLVVLVVAVVEALVVSGAAAAVGGKDATACTQLGTLSLVPGRCKGTMRTRLWA